jgi:hypothetical protein
MMTEMIIEGYKVDIDKQLSNLITYSIDDVKDFAGRNTSFSKTIVLPGTSWNNKIFGHIFDIGSANPYDDSLSNVLSNFNAAVHAQCYIFQDNIQVFKGVIRLLEIIVDKDVKEYEVAVFGELVGLLSAMGTNKLEDLDFSAYDLVYTTAAIFASWDNPGGSGVYFPLIDYGSYSIDKHNWDYRTFRPALYAKEYIDKIFAAADYRYSCDLFDTARFKSLIIPNNRKTLQRYSSQTFFVTAPAHTYNGVSDPLDLLTFTTHILTAGFTNNGASTEWTNTDPFDGTFSVNIRGSYSGKSAGSTLRFNFLKNGVAMATIPFGSSQTSGTFDFTLDATAIVAGDVISVEFVGPPGYTLEVTADMYNTSSTQQLIDMEMGGTIEVNANLPQNILQRDFLASIIKMFNLYVYEDKFEERKLHITPFTAFYEGSEVVDWSYKLDRNSLVRIKPMSELNSRYYNFKFKSDSDYYNDLYRKRYNQGYGDRIYDSEYEFTNDTKPIEVIFSSTPLVGYSGEDKVYSTIFKRSGSTEETTDSNIRILQTKKITGVTSWQVVDGASVIGTLDYYGYAGHLDDPSTPDNDINFGVPKELFFTYTTGSLTNNQFNMYWSTYMAEITDKDSKLVTAKFYLTPKDIFDLNFSTYIVIDGVIFRLNKIIDYNAKEPGLCTVELLKAIRTNYTFPAVPGSDRFLLWNDVSPLIDSDSIEIFYG